MCVFLHRFSEHQQQALESLSMPLAYNIAPRDARFHAMCVDVDDEMPADRLACHLNLARVFVRLECTRYF